MRIKSLPRNQNHSDLGVRHLLRYSVYLLDYITYCTGFVNLMNTLPTSVFIIYSIKIHSQIILFRVLQMLRTWIQILISLTMKSRFSRTSDEWRYLVRLFYKYTNVLLLKHILKVLWLQQLYKLQQIWLIERQLFSFPSIKNHARGSSHGSRK